MNARSRGELDAAGEAQFRARVDALDWTRVGDELDAQGNAVVAGLLSRGECAALASLYGRDEAFRSRVVMSRHGYGRGEYRYFAYPLPATVAGLRAAVYPHLVPIADRWHEAMGSDVRFPADHARFLARCHAAAQSRPTPLLLRYRAGDYNCLHQDLYGEHVFPLQLTILLSEPVRDFDGGEFVMTEQRPRMQSRPQVVALRQGDAVVFAVNHRPVRGTRGFHRVTMRHGVSRVHRGERYTAGIIFHDAE
ncbi:MAG TPA: 2OG-Fe(II) oxygenase [Casimicrobiaceae bacterium]|nr:2OG-Fe(II) oxygenase [Casimicrobiaceae bacterium]